MENIYIFGCGRSGTSILGELFENIPVYRYYFEPELSDVKKSTLRPFAAKVPRVSKIDNITPGLTVNLNDLSGKFKVIFIVRNPLDTVCSLKPGISKNWSHNPKPPGHKEMLDSLTLEECCAHHWNYINSTGFKTLQSVYGDRVIVVRYEDLIRDTKNTVRRILTHCKSPSFFINLPGIKKYMSKISDQTSNTYHAKRQTRWFVDNHTKRIGRWEEELSKNQANDVLAICKVTASHFNYDY